MNDYYSGLREKLIKMIVAERADEYRGLPRSAREVQGQADINNLRMAVDTMASFLIHVVRKHNDEYGVSPNINLGIEKKP